MKPTARNTTHSLQDEVQELIAAVNARIGQRDLSAAAPEAVLAELLALAAGREEYAPLLAHLRQSLQRAQQWQYLLQDLLAQLEALEADRIQRQHYSQSWWDALQQALDDDFRKDAEQGWAHWLRAFTEALIDWELEICRQLANAPYPFPQEAIPVLALARDGVQALLKEEPQNALEMLMRLCGDEAPPASSIGAAGRAILLARAGQIQLYHANAPEAALTCFAQAQKDAPGEGRIDAPMGDYYRSTGDAAQASRLYQQAVEYAPDRPEGFIGLALMAEKQGRWEEADEWYAQALNKVKDAGSVDIALRKVLGLTQADGNYPERLRYRLHGELLEAFRQPGDAAEAFYQAGARFNWRREAQPAVELLERAKELDPARVPTYWQLSDALWLKSYRPGPPYVDEATINASLAVWEAGAAIEPPGAGYTWAYLTRALINEQRARLPGAALYTLWWEGITFFERSLLFSETDPYAWAYLSRYHRNLENAFTSIQTAENAVRYARDDTARFIAFGEKAAILGNVGFLEEAGEAIDGYLALRPDDAWALSVKAFILAFTGHYAEALDVIETCIQNEPESVWYREVRALCNRMSGRYPEAIADYDWMWQLHDNPAFADQRSAISWAAYSLFLLGREGIDFVDKAIEIGAGLLEDVPGAMTYRNLGVFYLARGDLERGEAHLIEGINRTVNFRELDELRDIDLKDLEKFSTRWPHRAQLVTLLEDKIKPAIAARRKATERRPTAIEELTTLRDAAESDAQTGGWMWLGAQAGLARLYATEGRWEMAGLAYGRLRSETAHFPEAIVGLEKAEAALRDRGQTLLKDGQPAEAKTRFVQALMLQVHPDDQQEQADLYARIGCCYLDMGDVDAARATLVRALGLYREAQVPCPGEALGATGKTLLRDAAHYWQLDAQWEAFERDPATEAALRRDLAEARESLREYLDALYRLTTLAGEASSRQPLVTPIAIELGDRLIPPTPGVDWPLIKTYLPDMRARIEGDIGVTAPSVRIRASDELAPEAYLIQIDEIPRATGRVYVDRRYTPASPDALGAAGIAAAAVIQAPHPVTGKTGCWVEAADWESVTQAGLELWPEALVYVVSHLEDILRQNLADFLGIQEVENLLDAWAKTDDGASLIQAALPDGVSRLRFARVLRALVRERVPITRWETILEAVRGAGLESDDVHRAVCAVRLRLTPQLPGNTPEARRILLPQALEDELARWVWHADGKTFFAIPPQQTQNALNALRGLVEADDRSQVLVTRGAELRPFVRRLAEIEHPYLMVLAQEEVEGASSDEQP